MLTLMTGRMTMVVVTVVARAKMMAALNWALVALSVPTAVALVTKKNYFIFKKQ